MEGVNASIIRCEFVTGSTANGCIVVLTGFRKYNINLVRDINTNSAATTITLEHPPSCYTGVEAFDIKSDGSAGVLAVPGQLGGRLETPSVYTNLKTYRLMAKRKRCFPAYDYARTRTYYAGTRNNLVCV